MTLLPVHIVAADAPLSDIVTIAKTKSSPLLRCGGPPFAAKSAT